MPASAGGSLTLPDPLPTADESPPLVQLAAGGDDLDPGVAVDALPATPGRVFAQIQLVTDDPDGRLWVRFDGADAAVGIGESVTPDGQWSAPTASAVSVYYEGTGTCRYCTSELAAG